MSTDEKITAFAFAVTVSLWIFGAAIGVNAVAAALLGLGILLITGVTTWCASVLSHVDNLRSEVSTTLLDNCDRRNRRNRPDLLWAVQLLRRRAVRRICSCAPWQRNSSSSECR